MAAAAEKMIRNVVAMLGLIEVILCHPQSIRIPDIRNKAPPEEINQLVQHRQYPRSIETNSALKSHNNVEATIKEVEDMIKANPTLPRLTRGEILDLLENITKADMAKNTLPNENVKDRDPKAIMVVMPYTPSNSNENNMEELFTKPPVTHIVGAEPFKKTLEKSISKPKPTDITNTSELDKVKMSTAEKDKLFRGNIQKKTTTSTTTTASAPTVSTSTKGLIDQSTYTEKKPHQRRRRPAKPTTEQQTSSTERPTVPLTTYHPKGRRPVRRRPTTTEKHPNHRYPDETTTETAKEISSLSSSGIRIIDAPKLSPSKVNDDLYTQENQAQNVFVKKTTSELFNNVPEKQVQIPIVDNKHSTTDFALTDLVPDHLKGVLEDMNPEQLVKDPSKLSLASILPSPEEEDMKNVLPSFVARPSKKTTTTTTTSAPDISNVADNLSPEMRDLLMSFGLIPNPQDTVAAASEVVDSYNPVEAEVKPESYVGFKPLPEDQSSRHEMEELLAQFGLGRSSRREKSLPKKRDNEQLTFDAVPEQFKGVLEDIGLTDRQGKKIRAESLVKITEKEHIFSPVDKQYASNEELEKLNKLLDVVKQLEKLNGTVTDEDLKKIDVDNLKELVSSLNEENKIVPLDEQSAPNPVNYDYGLNKNDVKRQQNSSSTTPPTTEETVTPNIKDLEDSFGGQPDSSPTTSTAAPETTTQARRTGFYYLVDWNTFLDIDDQKGKRVNLRFQPTIGDPKRFYSVTVP